MNNATSLIDDDEISFNSGKTTVKVSNVTRKVPVSDSLLLRAVTPRAAEPKTDRRG